VMRPVFFADTDDPNLRAEDDAFLIGSDLLVIPNLAEKGQKTCAEPQGIWRPISLVADEVNQPQLKIRGGAIIPLGKVVQNTTENSLEQLSLVICLDDKGRAEGQLYEDAGDGFDYTKGDCRLTHFTAKQKDTRVTVTLERKGRLPALDRKVSLELITEKGTIQAEGRESLPIEINL